MPPRAGHCTNENAQQSTKRPDARGPVQDWHAAQNLKNPPSQTYYEHNLTKQKHQPYSQCELGLTSSSPIYCRD